MVNGRDDGIANKVALLSDWALDGHQKRCCVETRTRIICATVTLLLEPEGLTLGGIGTEWQGPDRPEQRGMSFGYSSSELSSAANAANDAPSLD